MSQINSDDYVGKYLANSKVEWLMEHGKAHDTVYFRDFPQAQCDRYGLSVVFL